ncbi:hypothetical protein FCM35_KLT12347 [Carex littledalei]|uniref:Uncharacterized protein n=1 Tax=Carex littledalei TaxID=544730 RepID=A0A833QQ71_9POAL|nr:hypothetical protein FCM35_KLT12347 [Carex littledalei]
MKPHSHVASHTAHTKTLDDSRKVISESEVNLSCSSQRKQNSATAHLLRINITFFISEWLHITSKFKFKTSVTNQIQGYAEDRGLGLPLWCRSRTARQPKRAGDCL